MATQQAARGLSPLGRAANFILTSVTKQKWGHRADLIADIVRRDGPIRTLRWFATNLPAYEKILAEWGPIRTHTMTSTLSLINGCPYCVHGHGLSLNLYYFRDNDELFALSAKEMRELAGDFDESEQDRPARMQSVMEKALTASDLENLVPWVQDLVRIKETGEAEGADEEKLLHLVEMFEVLNVCGRDACTVPDRAHSPIDRDSELAERYDQARPGDVLHLAA